VDYYDFARARLSGCSPRRNGRTLRKTRRYFLPKTGFDFAIYYKRRTLDGNFHARLPGNPCTKESDYNVASMIAHLRGRLNLQHPNQAVVEPEASVTTSPSACHVSELPGTGGEVALHIHTTFAKTQSRYSDLSDPRRNSFSNG